MRVRTDNDWSHGLEEVQAVDARQLRFFLAVIDSQGFSRAAE
jgi:hypothetical protein